MILLGSFMGKGRGEKTKKVYDYIKTTNSATLKEIARKTAVNYNTVRGVVQKLEKIGLVKRIGRGIYGPARES
jgi:predicted transcriptional regulator